jgi:hypothetical protein
VELERRDPSTALRRQHDDPRTELLVRSGGRSARGGDGQIVQPVAIEVRNALHLLEKLVERDPTERP